MRGSCAVTGVATLAVAALPLPSRAESSTAHAAVATASFVLLGLWPWFAARSGGPRVLTARVARTAAVVLTASVASLGLGVSGGSFGLHERIVAALRAIVPGEGVISAPEELRPYESDGLTAYRQPPMVVVLPETVDQVAAILRWCHAHGVKVVPREDMVDISRDGVAAQV